MTICVLLLLLQVSPDNSHQKLPPGTPTYERNVAPIVQENCAPCHRPGAGGPFSLLTYEDVLRHASQIAVVTNHRYMPPWLPDSPAGTFRDERLLSHVQIQTIADWVAAHSPAGDLSQSRAVPISLPNSGTNWQLGPPDLIVKATQPLHLNASGSDVFWNFLFATPLTSTRYVRAIEIHPDKDRLVHHANLLVDRTGVTRKMERSPGAGFSGMDLDITRNPLDPESHFLFWKPGSQPYAEPDGFSWQLNPGNVLVLNTHLQPSGKPEDVSPSIGIYFTGKAPAKFPILVQLQHDGAIDIPPGARNFEVEDHLTLPENVRLLAIYPHAHYLGTLLEGNALLPDGTSLSLIRIPHWDLNQQAVYRYREPMFLPKGTVVSMRFYYDNSALNVRNPQVPPQRVRAGNGATDEMGHLWFQFLPEGKGDHRRPVQEAVIRHRIQQEPADAINHLNLAALLLSRLDAQSAITELRVAVHLDPKRPAAYDMLGAALQNTGQLQPAIEQFRRALRVDPTYMSAQYNLAFALVKIGQLDEALAHLEPVAKAYPQDERLQNEYQSLQSRCSRAAARP